MDRVSVVVATAARIGSAATGVVSRWRSARGGTPRLLVVAPVLDIASSPCRPDRKAIESVALVRVVDRRGDGR